MTRRLLVTSALPYANGDIHIGHLVEYIQTDIWSRFQKLRGHECHYICADDTHGTPIMLSAKKQGITPEELITKMHAQHQADFEMFHIDFDYFGSTNCPENKFLSESIYNASVDDGAIVKRHIQQSYCDDCGMFLPDRFIRGNCPKCDAENQYGDSCEVCSSTYATTELQNPSCAECGTTPITKESEHHFFQLSKFEKQLQEWITQSTLRPEIKNKLQEWFQDGLKDWDISRDAPYFGFKIPGTNDKYFYVWLDAPVGYMAATQNYCAEQNHNFDSMWKNGDYEIHHFIGKDIMYFHTLFWPAMLMVSGFSLPTKINVHGFLTINAEKMSKSRGTFVLARDFAEHVNPEALRYYYAAKLSDHIEDMDLNIDDFVLRVNADVVNKFVNIGSRLASIVTKKCDGLISEPDAEGTALLQECLNAVPKIEEYYENLQYNKAMTHIMKLADMANKYVNDTAPWNVVKTDLSAAQQICTAGLNILKLLAILLKPVLPVISTKVEQFLNIPEQQWTDIPTLLTEHRINAYEHLAKRLEITDAQKIFKV